jgi:hypothetical protein
VEVQRLGGDLSGFRVDGAGAEGARVNRTLATVAGEELPDLVVRGRIERLVVAPLQRGQLVLGEGGGAEWFAM